MDLGEQTASQEREALILEDGGASCESPIPWHPPRIPSETQKRDKNLCASRRFLSSAKFPQSRPVNSLAFQGGLLVATGAEFLISSFEGRGRSPSVWRKVCLRPVCLETQLAVMHVCYPCSASPLSCSFPPWLQGAPLLLWPGREWGSAHT